MKTAGVGHSSTQSQGHLKIANVGHQIQQAQQYRKYTEVDEDRNQVDNKKYVSPTTVVQHESVPMGYFYKQSVQKRHSQVQQSKNSAPTTTLNSQRNLKQPSVNNSSVILINQSDRSNAPRKSSSSSSHNQNAEMAISTYSKLQQNLQVKQSGIAKSYKQNQVKNARSPNANQQQQVIRSSSNGQQQQSTNAVSTHSNTTGGRKEFSGGVRVGSENESERRASQNYGSATRTTPNTVFTNSGIYSYRKSKPVSESVSITTPGQRIVEQQARLTQSLLLLQQETQRRVGSGSRMNTPLSNTKPQVAVVQQPAIYLKVQSDLTLATETESSVINLRDNIKQFNFKPALSSSKRISVESKQQSTAKQQKNLSVVSQNNQSLQTNESKQKLLSLQTCASKKVVKKASPANSQLPQAQVQPKKIVLMQKYQTRGASTGFSTSGSGDMKSKERQKKIRADSAGQRLDTNPTNQIAKKTPSTGTQRVHSHQPSSKQLDQFEVPKSARVSEPSGSTFEIPQDDPKEVIVQYISRYIKQKKTTEPSSSQSLQTDEILKNLRDFLVYLEGKNIINPQKLQNKEEMKILLKDIMKLDLSKFSKPRKSSQQSQINNDSSRQSKRKAHPSPATNTDNKIAPQSVQLISQRRKTTETNQSPSNVREENYLGSNQNHHRAADQSPKNLNIKQKTGGMLQSSNRVQNAQQLQPRIQSNPPVTKNYNSNQNSSSKLLLEINQQQRASSTGNKPKLGQSNQPTQSKIIQVQHQQKVGNKIEVPTIQLMINSNNQQKYLGINVNNYCIQPTQQIVSGSQPRTVVTTTTVNSPTDICSHDVGKNWFSNEGSGSGEFDPVKKVILNDPISQDRERLIKYIKAHVKKHNSIPQTTLDFYKFVKLLGKGAFGKITLGIHKLTGKKVAIKSIDKANIKDEYSRRKVFQEVYILKKIRHSCVIRLLEVFESEKHFLMVMEYSGGGDLLQYVKKRKRLNEQSAKAIFKQILYALGHCHCRSVLHRDIKLDNVLMDGDGGVKLCDFGVSRLVKKGQTIQEQCGTPAYLAPEIILDQGYQGFSADIWSLGVLLYAMVQGTVPFKAQNIVDLHKLILEGKFEFPVESVSDEVKDLIKQMIVLKPENRISIPQMLNHSWVRDVEKSLLSGTDNEDEQDLQVGTTFFRQEVLGGLIPGAQNSGNENGNINFVNIENLYYRGGEPVSTHVVDKITYSDYCALTEDFMTYRIDEEALEVVTSCGYPRNLVLDSINKGEVNHATAAYYLLLYSNNEDEQ